MMMDIKNYYLGTPLPRFEYIKMLLSRFPNEIIQKYNLNTLVVDGFMSRLSTAPRRSMPRRMKHPRSPHNNVSQSRKSQDPFCTTPEQLIPPS
jgi:hypothetical protein